MSLEYRICSWQQLQHQGAGLVANSAGSRQSLTGFWREECMVICASGSTCRQFAVHVVSDVKVVVFVNDFFAVWECFKYRILLYTSLRWQIHRWGAFNLLSMMWHLRTRRFSGNKARQWSMPIQYIHHIIYFELWVEYVLACSETFGNMINWNNFKLFNILPV